MWPGRQSPPASAAAWLTVMINNFKLKVVSGIMIYHDMQNRQDMPVDMSDSLFMILHIDSGSEGLSS